MSSGAKAGPLLGLASVIVLAAPAAALPASPWVKPAAGQREQALASVPISLHPGHRDGQPREEIAPAFRKFMPLFRVTGGSGNSRVKSTWESSVPVPPVLVKNPFLTPSR
jgi:hypothetical protein